jgi:hypothetical protein
VIYVPAVHFPDGYRVAVQGGRATSAKDASLLVVRRAKHADEVSVTLSSR